MKKVLFSLMFVFVFVSFANAEYLGNLSTNPYDPNSINNPYGAGNPYNPNSVTNPYGQYGNPYGPNSATNPYATDAPKLLSFRSFSLIMQNFTSSRSNASKLVDILAPMC